jgi:transcriptional regulator with XRE-family HTH domain
MTTGKKVREILEKGEYVKAKTRIALSPAQSLKMIREFQELSQNQLSELTGLPQSTISGMEAGRINIGVERAKVLARALKVHPATLVFPGWDVSEAS